MTKKLLLTATMLSGYVLSFAGQDPTVYAPAGGLTCENLWLTDLNHAMSEWTALGFTQTYKARTATVVNEKAIIAFSQTMPDGEESNDFAHLVFLDMPTGKYEKTVQVTVDGEPVKGLLCANQIGTDDYGHVWLTGLLINNTKTSFKIYHITDPDKGTAELAAELALPDSEFDAEGRHDYFDLVGDITGAEGRCVFMTPVASGKSPFVLGWQREQGSEEWQPLMSGGDYVSLPVEETYPSGQTTWNGAPMVRIIRDEEHSGYLFYVDAFVTCPTLYNTEGTMLDSFASAADLAPKPGPNGVMEFSVGGSDLLAYVYNDYDGDPGSRFNVVKLGDGQTFEGMELLWTLPETGFGMQSDSGTRAFSICPTVYTDERGKQGAYVFAYKCYNGMGVYKIAQEGWLDWHSGITDAVADDIAGATEEYFNMQGMRVPVRDLTPGVYVVRQGHKVVKTVIK